jgi:hypothetical protein
MKTTEMPGNIRRIKNKIKFGLPGSVTFAERNIVNIYDKKQRKLKKGK